jgi:putative MATE family efflux protein
LELEVKKPGLLHLVIPIFLELLLTTIVVNIDILMVSKYSIDGTKDGIGLGVGVLGGMSQILQTQNVIFSLVSLGTGILTAQYIGAKREKEINETIAVSLTLNMCLGIVMGVLYYLFATVILTKIKLSPTLIGIGINYFKIVGGFCIFQAISLTIGAVIRSYGHTKQPFYVSIIINIINVLFNGMFLFGWFGAPIKGITGVGIATAFSRFIGMLILIIMLFKYTNFKKIKEYLKPFPKDILRYLAKIGVPSGMEHLSWNISQIIILSMVNTMGTPTIMARTYLTVIATFMMMFSIALGSGTSILTGRLVGEKKMDEAYNQLLKSLKISFTMAGVLAVLVFLFKDIIIKGFTLDSEIINISKKVFWVYIFVETGRTFNIVVVRSLQAVGDVKYPMIIGISIMFGVSVPVAWLLGVHYQMGLVGIWLAYAIDEWIRGVLMLKRWTSKKWTKRSLIESE